MQLADDIGQQHQCRCVLETSRRIAALHNVARSNRHRTGVARTAAHVMPGAMHGSMQVWWRHGVGGSERLKGHMSSVPS